jgi:hypothetical protein
MSLTEKLCRDCGEVKPISEFWKNKNHSTGYKVDCKDCARKRNRKWESENKERRSEYHRSKNIKKAYGLDRADYNKLLEYQGGVCAFCQNACTLGRELSVDHDHETGVIRGLLCASCNVARVSNHTIQDARRLVQYLTEPPAVRVIGRKITPDLA